MWKKIDFVLLYLVIVLGVFGYVFFGSAALGVLVSNEAKFYSVIEQQFFSLIAGIVLMIIFIRVPYEEYCKKAGILYGVAIFLTGLTLIPGIGISHNGASRWLSLGFMQIQPSELLKFAFIAAVTALCFYMREKMQRGVYSIGLILLVTLPVAAIMYKQPDMTTLGLILIGGYASWFCSGVKLKHVSVLILLFVMLFGVAATFLPHMQQRIETFFNSSQDFHGSSWQLNQSLIALGAGGWSGRGLGQSIQKYSYLPEPIGDSIIAVIGEEIGFLGVTLLMIVYIVIAYRGYMIALYAKGFMGRMLAAGITTLVVVQAIINIAANSDSFFLVGVPLPFVSHGGTALVLNYILIGILLNISTTRKLSERQEAT